VKAKSSNKTNILLIAITLLLFFVMGINLIGKTNSWLVSGETIGFRVQIGEINIYLQQGERKIKDGEYVYLYTESIEANKTYLTDNTVAMVNAETASAFYLRFQAIAMVNGVAYNINSYITGSDFYNRKDSDSDAWWMYSVNDKNAQNPVNAQIPASTTLTMLKDIVFPQSFVDEVQGQYFKLYLFIEGSINGEFI
jgi:ABC-type transport system involved in multi-copper enzyme maturation permease subunit